MTSPSDGRASPAVSVVIPVYNTRPYLAECLDSVLASDLAPGELEVVAVDDGSTDGCAELLDAYAARHPNLRVIHQPNSGWPGGPRNVGRRASRGAYVFFADSDDCLAPQALRRMHEFAVEHGSDVVVPKVVPLDGPARPDPLWRRNQVDARLTLVIRTLGPWKLFRRDLLDEHNLWFPEGRVRLEDGIFVTQAYLAARRVSILGDAGYYRKRTQPDSGNISATPVDPDGYVASLATMMQIIRRAHGDSDLADALVVTLYRRKALKWFRPERFAGYRPAQREAWVRAVHGLQEAAVPPRLDDRLPLVHRLRSVLVRHTETAALAHLGAAEQAGRRLPLVLSDGWFELPVPGLRTQPALVVTPGLRLVPAADATPRRPRSTPLVEVARRLAEPGRRRVPGVRRMWTWAHRLRSRRGAGRRS